MTVRRGGVGLGRQAGWGWAVVCLSLTVATRAAAAGDPGPSLSASEPRAFGWRLGDVIEREVLVSLPDGWRLRADSLPPLRTDGRALELQAVQRQSANGQERLLLRYQVMRSPPELRTWELPPLRLQVQGPSRTESLRVDAWPVVVGPLGPQEASPREGLGALRPDRPPPPRSDAARPWRVAAEAGLLAAGLAALARARWGTFWRRDNQRPLAQAWRQLRRLPATADAAAVQAALQTLHQALNRSAGQVLLGQAVPNFCQARPAFAPVAEGLQRFFAVSDQVFFQQAGVPTGAAAELRRLARQLRDAERST